MCQTILANPEIAALCLLLLGYYSCTLDITGYRMETTSASALHSYNPDNLLNALIEKLGLKNDAALARLLEVAPPILSKIRHRRLPVGAALLIRMHEVSNMPIRELRDLMGDRRQKYRISLVQGKPKES